MKKYIAIALFVASLVLPSLACKESPYGDTVNRVCQTSACIERNRKK